MKTFGVDHGLFVAWGGYKSSVEKEEPKHFFESGYGIQMISLELFLRTIRNCPRRFRQNYL